MIKTQQFKASAMDTVFFMLLFLIAYFMYLVENKNKVLAQKWW